MATPQIDVYLPDGTVQNHQLVDEKVKVGASSACQVMIDRPEFSPEHLLLVARPEGVWVAVARGVATPTLVDGITHDRGMVPWGKSITVGPTRIVLNDGTKTNKKGGKDKDKKEEGVSPVILLAAAVIVPMALYTSFSAPGSDVPGRVQQQPPALFDSLQRQCPEREGAMVRNAAEESTRVAMSKAERMPFRMQDGIDAVNYYAQASACFRIAGDGASAELAMQRATRLQARLEDEYRAHQFRLDRSLEQSRVEDALYEARMLKAMTTHRRGAYYTALVTLERQLQLRVDQNAAARR
jgi:hypothetical protein